MWSDMRCGQISPLASGDFAKVPSPFQRSLPRKKDRRGELHLRLYVATSFRSVMLMRRTEAVALLCYANTKK